MEVGRKRPEGETGEREKEDLESGIRGRPEDKE